MLRVLLVVDDYGEMVYLQTLLKKLGFDVEGIQNPRMYEDTRLAFNPEIIIFTAQGKRVNGLEMVENLKRRNRHPKIAMIFTSAQLEKAQDQEFENVDAAIESPISAKDLIEVLAELGKLEAETLVEKYRKFKLNLSAEEEAELATLVAKEDEDSMVHVKGSSSTQADGAYVGSSPANPNQLPLQPGSESASTQQPTQHPKVTPSAFDHAVSDGRFSDVPDAEGAVQIDVNKPLQFQPSTMSATERKKRFQDFLKAMDKPKPGHFLRSRIVEFNKQIRAAEDPDKLRDLELERQSFVKELFKKAKVGS